MITSLELLLLLSTLLWLLVWMPRFSEDTTRRGKTGRWFVYTGTSTRGDSESRGIYLLEMDELTGNLTEKGLVAATQNPSFVALHPDGMHLYAVGEVIGAEGNLSGVVVAFEIDRNTGVLTRLNSQPSGGENPCHLVVDQTGSSVLVANYGSGSVASLLVQQDGQLGNPVSVMQHTGSSVDPTRQEGPHAHSINVDGANRFAFAADLGLDKVLIYDFHAKTSKLTPHDPSYVDVPPGSGPRHFSFHPSTNFAYVINEMSNTIIVFSYESEKGELTPLETVSTLPKDYEETSHSAEVVVHPSGKFLYASNRGHDSITIFAIDQKTGKLTLVGHEIRHINIPRNFVIDPSGKFLIVACQASGEVVVFAIDPESGLLSPNSIVANVPTPICVRMLRVPSS